jgi:hypothetical protein
MYGDTNISAPAPQQVNYGESMKEGLEAQIELAPDLYKAEADPDYGRKAYARLSQDIAMDSLLGEEVSYDNEGKQIEGYEPSKSQVAGKYKIVEKTEYKDFDIDTGTGNYKSTFTLMDAATGEVIDESTIDGYSGATDNAGLDREHAAWKQKRNKRISNWGDIIGEEALTKLQGQTSLNGQIDIEGKYEAAVPIYKKDAAGNIITDPSKAGQTTRAGGGLVDIYGGTEEFEFEDADGNIVKRRAGFDENGNFQGLSKLADELQTKSNDSRVAGELQLVKEYGDDFTKAYRDQGNIQGALDQVEKLSQKSSVPTDKLDAQGDRLSNLASSFGQGQQVGSVYNDQPKIGTNPVQSDAYRIPRPTTSGGVFSGAAGQKPEGQRIAEEAQSIGRRLGYRPNENPVSQQGAAGMAAAVGGGGGGMFVGGAGGGNVFGGGLNAAQAAAQAQGQPAQAGGGLGQNQSMQYIEGSPYAQESMNQTGVSERSLAQRMQDGTAMTESEVAAMKASSQGAAGMAAAVGGGGGLMGNQNPAAYPAPDEIMRNRNPRAPRFSGQGEAGMGANQTGVAEYDQRMETMGGSNIPTIGSQQVSQTRGGLMGNQNPAAYPSRDQSPPMPAQEQAQMMPVQQPSMLTDQKGVAAVNAQQVGSVGGLRNEFVTQARSDLKAGGDLTARELRTSQQQARAASTARGRGRDTSSVLSELRNNEMFSRERLNERRKFAGAVLGQEAQIRGMDISSDLQSQMTNQQTQLGLTQMDQAAQVANQSNELARQQMLLGATEKDIDRGIQVDQINTGNEMQGLQADRAAAAQRVGLEQATSADPLAAVTGRPSGAGVVGAGNLYGNAAGAGQVPMMYNPAQGAEFIANQAAGLNTYNAAIAGANATASAGKSNMFGQIIGAALPIPFMNE